ncbi:hypothetical protein Ciccas_006626 [Cichlidogyrus casuarinus]|uniref:FYVE-type domain-containing protein n=1 Tax=Cichlidogyrus casuarinus TaxID=1844966 RepID=A0ABD2Q923_9PLAT
MFHCKFCGTRFCNSCLRGEFKGEMKSPGICKMCNQSDCVGKELTFPNPPTPCLGEREKSKTKKSKGKKGKKGAKKSKGKKKSKKK